MDALAVFLLPLYTGREVWEGIWNQSHLVVLNFCVKRLHRITIRHDKARSDSSCQ